MNDTPLSLLDRLRQTPDEVSWRRLFDLYTPPLEAWLRRQGLSAADADDLMQDVFAAIFRDLPDFEHSGRRGAFRNWLRIMLVHRVRNFWRARRPGPGPGDPILDQLVEPESDLTKLWDREHDEFLARRLLELAEPEFSPTTWRSFHRQVVEGRPAAEVAVEMGLSVNAVLIAKSRVLRKIRNEARGLIDQIG
jgi:RNA polymerase sigma-70 factor (ECF subfamily)